MRRWNGWGDDRISKHLPDGAAAMLSELVGPGRDVKSVSLEESLAKVPASRLKEHHLIDRSREARLRHAVGQSLPDWVALRTGTIPNFPDGVAFPESMDHLEAVLAYAKAVGAVVIPYGGGTSVVGHLSAPKGDRPVLTISMAKLDQLMHFEPRSQLATFGAGVTGPKLEARLAELGYRLGHYPQSFEYATLGGWVVTRSSGQQSLGYGRIEDHFAGGTLLTPKGSLVMPPLPASSAGPDLRQLVLGSEGRLGVLGEVTIRVQKLPEKEVFHAWFFHNWQEGLDCVRDLSQAGIPLSMMRLSNAPETRTNLLLAGKEKQVGWLKTYLGLRDVGEEGTMLLIGFHGLKAQVKCSRSEAFTICRQHKGVHLHQPLGKAWSKNRFSAPYLRNTLWDKGYAVDTLETCVTWDRVSTTMNAIEAALKQGLSHINAKVHAFTHLSHFYTSGCSIYTTYAFELGNDAEDTLARWRRLKSAASEALVANGGTISHQHGVGTDHAPYLHHEKGSLGMDMLQQVFHNIDPEGRMNPDKLLVDKQP